MPIDKVEDLMRLFESNESLFWQDYETMWYNHTNEVNEPVETKEEKNDQ